MPRLRIVAIKALMTRRNIATKFELSQLCGTGYGRIRELLEGADNRVDEAMVKKSLSLIEQQGNGKALGRFLLEKGLISQDQFKAITTHIQKVAATEEAKKGAGSVARARAGNRPSGKGIRVVDAANADFSKLVGQPLASYLREARQLGASDLHFQVDAPPYLRLHGQIVYLKHPVLTPEYTEPRILEILDDFGRDVFTKHNDHDCCVELEHGRYRMNVARQRKGVDAVFRVIPAKVPTIEELHLPEALKKFTKYRQGIVLVTGAAGSGKTATMAALIDLINREQHDHIVTVEDPIEYIIGSQSCNLNQREVRKHTETYATALRSAMRSDPDYICVGEMRDLETVSMAITAAETGHLVFATLHTTNAVRSVDRIIDIFPPKEQEQIRSMVSESLRGVISQNLVPRADGLGREPAIEVLFATPAVGNMIREKKTFQLSSALQTGAKLGMITMDDSLGELVKKKIITRETAHFFAFQKERFE